jgi:hypothetical protein
MKNGSGVAMHVLTDEEGLRRRLTVAEGAGVAILNLDLARTLSIDDLERALIATFLIPDPCVGIDAIIDFTADLDEWMPNDKGYFLAIRGADDSPPEVVKMLAGALPAIMDRLRSGSVPFEAALVSVSSRSDVLTEVRATNTTLAEFGALPTTVSSTYAVPVFVDGQPDDG